MKKLTTVFIIILSITVAKAQQSRHDIDSLKHELTIAKEDTTKVHLLVLLSDLFYNSYADTCVAYAQEALDLAKKINFENGILKAEFSLTGSLMTSGNYPLALDHGLKLLSLAKKTDDPNTLVSANGTLAFCYYNLGEYNTCLKYVLESLHIAQAFHLAKYKYIYIWQDMAQAYQNLNQPDSALLYAKKAYERSKNSNGESYASNILGDAYAGKTNYDSALFVYRIAMSLSLKGNMVTELVDSYNGIAGVYKAKDNFDSAAWYSKKVLAEKIEKSYPIALLKAVNMLATIYESQNKPDSTLKYLRIAINLKDSLFSREKAMAVQNILLKEQENQKEMEASELKLQNRLRIYSLLAGLIVLLLTAGILLRNNRNKHKAYTLLQKQKLETDRQKEKTEFTLQELKSTQAQLIQSEKMASLGELTAGIAHEIQNPLNFVNNFSEVNTELVNELKTELKAGNTEDAFAIANDIKDNEEKILHHGKRADAIVKGMLQHSRASTGKKEPTDINALCDEYLRLAYHGLRAKDKSFNAILQTDFDESIGKINIVPQDIGRVLLNLFNNAFYALFAKASDFAKVSSDKSVTADGNYQPTVSVCTKKVDSKIEISIKDNGNGISQKVVDKIFQPFFTTKPTGQGTGLGLSLSYDIIKAHGGEIKVETKEGEGSEFIIQLPV